ncbi:arrestin homolog [Schistocerca piceifrons]|uniref:arrestin homolog n=1 Tax=Schistocerca piceifrons TaxID=274613 RepID=UPI001F5E8C3D|nr:arrestin homolog [Schistocerca piceifrons]
MEEPGADDRESTRQVPPPHEQRQTDADRERSGRHRTGLRERPQMETEVFKKSAPNNKLTLYLSSRDLIITDSTIEKLYGVLVVDPDYVQQRKVYGQVILTFRYGREDEEVMGLKFCNEAIMCLAQLYPPSISTPEITTPLQVRRSS